MADLDWLDKYIMEAADHYNMPPGKFQAWMASIPERNEEAEIKEAGHD